MVQMVTRATESRLLEVGEGHGREPGAEGRSLGEPGGERFRAMEREDAAGTGVGVAFITEESSDAGGFAEERQRAGSDGLNEVRQVFGAVAGLLRDTSQEGAFFLGLGDADGSAVQFRHGAGS
jgi:hypothetical protein